MRSSPILLGLALAAAASSSVGCSVISDLDRFETKKDMAGADAATPSGDAASADDAALTPDGGAAIGCGNPATLCLQLSGFEEFKGKVVVVDLVSGAGGLRARAVLDPASDAAMQSVVLPLAIPEDEIPESEEHPLHLEVWVDLDDDRRYSSDKDEGYRIGLPANGTLAYTRDDADLVDLSPGAKGRGGDFVMEVSGFQIHPKRMFEAMVIDKKTGRTLGLSRIGAIPSDGIFTVSVPGIIETGDGGGDEYIVEFYADANNDGTYGGVGPDHSWILEITSDADGIKFDRTHSAPSSGPGKDDPSFKFAELTYQFPFEQ